MLTLTTAVLAASLFVAFDRDASRPAKPAGGGIAGVGCPCPGDFDGNGMIDGADLAALLGGWGAPGTDLDGSGSTDAADLSILLGGWGPCAAVPANDLCADALPIFEGITPFCTVGAGTDAPPYAPNSGCDDFGYNTMTSDVWYSFIAPEAGTVTVSTCGAGWDTRLAVYASDTVDEVGCPISQSSDVKVIVCNDDFPGCGTGSKVSFFATKPGKEYKIRVGGFIGWSGEGLIDLEMTPMGAVCNEAIDLGITQGEFLEGSTLIYDVGPDQSPCASGDTIAKWYMFSTDCGHQNGTVTISTCHPGTDFDTTLSVWTFSPSSCPGNFVACNDDFADPACVIGALNRRSRVQFTLDGPSTYFVRVAGYNGAAGNFQLSIDVNCN